MSFIKLLGLAALLALIVSVTLFVAKMIPITGTDRKTTLYYGTKGKQTQTDIETDASGSGRGNSQFRNIQSGANTIINQGGEINTGK